MKRFASLLGGASAFFAALTLLEIDRIWLAPLALPKLLAGALTPIAAVAGGLSAMLGLFTGNLAATSAGLFGATIASRYIRKVAAPHDGFERAFGPDWRMRIPPALKARMLQVRWSPEIAQPPDVPWQRDVVFGAWPATGEPLLCDVWQPPGDTPHTGLGIIYLHGSGWHYLDKDVGTRPFFRHLASQGHVIMDVAYTLAPKADLYSMIGDVKRAIAWLKAHADDYGVNPDRIILMGGSAGGHLSLLAGYTPNDPEFQPEGLEADTSVRAVVSYYGPADLRAMYKHILTLMNGSLDSNIPIGNWLINYSAFVLKLLFPGARIVPPYGKIISAPEMITGLLGGTPREVPRLYEIGSPLTHAGPHCPPTLMLQGGHDLGVKPGPIRQLHQALCETGATSVYVEFPETDHGFDLFWPRINPAAQAATYDVERFLALMI